MLWIKALHIISVIAWMAGLLYLPRLYVYHCACKTRSRQSETFKIMERRLYRAIMTPALILSWSFGGALFVIGGSASEGWMILKWGLVVVLTAVHFLLGHYRLAFERDENTMSAKFYRLINEVPTVLMVGIVILVVVRPF